MKDQLVTVEFDGERQQEFMFELDFAVANPHLFRKGLRIQGLRLPNGSVLFQPAATLGDMQGHLSDVAFDTASRLGLELSDGTVPADMDVIYA